MTTCCEHESGQQAQHLGHHEHPHGQGAVGAGDKSKATNATKASAVLDVGDCHFHCQCMADLPAAVGTPLVVGCSPLAD